MTIRQARRRLGSRTHRRANTNGKVIYTSKHGGGTKKLPMRRSPQPVTNLGPRVRRLIAA